MERVFARSPIRVDQIALGSDAYLFLIIIMNFAISFF